MRAFTSDELERMQAAQGDAMQDTCVRLAYGSSSTDDYGMPVATYTAGEAMSCGFDPTAKEEAMDGTQVVMTDAKLRLPIGTTLDHRDRIRITHRFGVALASPPTFEIIGEPERGPSGLVLNLRLVTDGSG